MATLMNGINNIFPSTSLTPVYFSSSTLAASDLNNLSSTAFQLVAAPGISIANIPYSMTAYSSTNTGGSGSSSVNITNGGGTSITAATLFLGIAGTSVMNTSSFAVSGVTTATYTNLNNTTTCLKGGSITGTAQTCTILTRYYVIPLV